MTALEPLLLGDIALVPLTRGRAVAIIDAADLPKIVGRSWHLTPHGYARSDIRRNGRRVRLYMHRVILDTPATVDHANRNKLDNRRCNLRPATTAQQATNSAPRNRYRGVSYFPWDKRQKRWVARIFSGDRRQHIGYYATAEEAARAYDAVAIELFGEFAFLNFPDEVAA